jgi:hypothetical protein
MTLNRDYVQRPARPPIISNRQPIQSAPRSGIIQAQPQRVVTPMSTAIAAQGRPTAPAPNVSAPVSPNMVMPAHKSSVYANAMQKMQARTAEKRMLSAKELKDRNIEQAIAEVTPAKASKTKLIDRKAWFTKHLVGSLVLGILSLVSLGYLVYLNLPDISVKVSASQVGIETAFPSYRPSGYNLDGFVSVVDNKVSMTFKNGADSYTITEERSSWDSLALFDNFVQKEWQDAIVSKERGLTIYINGSDAAWVNGGVLYKITGSSALTKQHIHDIAISM